MTWELDTPERIVLRVEAPAGGLLVLADAYAPGWTAWGGGQELPIVPADVALRGVVLPPGFDAEVVFTYTLPGRRGGRALAWLSLLLLAVLCTRRETLGPADRVNSSGDHP